MEGAQRLCWRLTQEKKILLILDDVWEKLDFGGIGIPSSEHHKDYEIPVQLLIRYAVGLGVVGEAHSYEESRNEVIAAKGKLLNSCLLFNEEDEYLKMHDIVCDVAHLIAKNENKIILSEEEKDVTIEQDSVRYLWCVKFPNDLDCSNQEFLFLKTKLEELDGIFKKNGNAQSFDASQ
ncbi:hypothetical protein VNO80_01208 [Phaseolus coccineus]|uniref:NB-ARC domain-containing protein n=1 Tax=Phaseolus coccineus TaxID=3886 RepID=A0AAN9P3K3_PHACN